MKKIAVLYLFFVSFNSISMEKRAFTNEDLDYAMDEADKIPVLHHEMPKTQLKSLVLSAQNSNTELTDVPETPWTNATQIATTQENDDTVLENQKELNSSANKITNEDSDYEDDKAVIPLLTRPRKFLQNKRTLHEKYQYIQPQEWQSVRARKYRVSCPACNEIIKAEDYSAFVKEVRNHVNKHDNVDEVELIEDYDKDLDYDLIARCISCDHVCSKRYFTIIGAFKALHTHIKNRHKQKFSHGDLDSNAKDLQATKKYIMIRKLKIKQETTEIKKETDIIEQEKPAVTNPQQKKIPVRKTIKKKRK